MDWDEEGLAVHLSSGEVAELNAFAALPDDHWMWLRDVEPLLLRKAFKRIHYLERTVEGLRP